MFSKVPFSQGHEISAGVIVTQNDLDIFHNDTTVVLPDDSGDAIN